MRVHAYRVWSSPALAVRDECAETVQHRSCQPFPEKNSRRTRDPRKTSDGNRKSSTVPEARALRAQRHDGHSQTRMPVRPCSPLHAQGHKQPDPTEETATHCGYTMTAAALTLALSGSPAAAGSELQNALDAGARKLTSEESTERFIGRTATLVSVKGYAASVFQGEGNTLAGSQAGWSGRGFPGLERQGPDPLRLGGQRAAGHPLPRCAADRRRIAQLQRGWRPHRQDRVLHRPQPYLTPANRRETDTGSRPPQ